MPELLSGVGDLSQFFTGVTSKLLSPVEADSTVSNQHEINGVAELERVFGRPEGKARITTTFIYVDEDEDPVDETGVLTFYDARAKHPTRTELRLYYPAASEVMRRARPGDQIIVARTPDGAAIIIVGHPASTPMTQLRWIFGIELPGERFTASKGRSELQRGIDLPAMQILELLGIEVLSSPEPDYMRAVERFNGVFPTTGEFSEFARSFIGDSAFDLPADERLITWMTAEEGLFRALERVVVEQETSDMRSSSDFDVDEFVRVSLRVQNRRKSRAGHSFENHLMALFGHAGLRYTNNGSTEGKKRPDFVFPSIAEYHDDSFPVERLTVLGAKTSCKDRWRQVLSEGRRTRAKHLITMESPISSDQVAEMVNSDLQLVVPRPLHAPFSPPAAAELMDVEEFIAEMHRRQTFTGAGFEVV